MPVTIKWQNRNQNGFKKRLFKVVTFILISVLLLFTLGLILFGRYHTQELVTPFRQTRCRRFYAHFDDKLPLYSEQAYARITKYLDTYTSASKIDLYDLSLVACYCAALRPDDSNLQTFSVNKNSYKIDYDMIKKSDPDGIKNELCESLSSQVRSAYLLKAVSDKSILVINILLRSLVIWVIKKLKSSNKSTETKRIMICVFLIQFFNTGPLLILTNADLSQVGIPLLDAINAGFH